MASRNTGLAKSLVHTNRGSRPRGTAFIVGGGLLLLAVGDVHVDGERLEGVGVAPTIEVQDDPDSTDRSDPQLNRAIAVLSEA